MVEGMACLKNFMLMYSAGKCLVISKNIIGHRSIKRWVAPTIMEINRRKKKMGPQPLQRRSSFLEWNYQAELFAFGKRLGEDFNKDLLQIAFTHRSYIIEEEMRQKEVGIENPEISLDDNQALAKKGETLLTEFIQHYLRITLPLYPEEGIQALHSHLISTNTLAHVSANIGTRDLILSSDFPVEETTLATTLKAIVGALIESSGEKRAKKFVHDFIISQLSGKDVNDFWTIENSMQVLADILKRDGRDPPEPRLISECGKNTLLAVYQVAVYSDKKFIGAGSGETVATAVEMAALDALRRLFKTTENMKPILNTYSAMSGNKQHPNLSIDNWCSRAIQ